MALAATVPASAASRYTTRYRHHRGHIRRVAWNPVLRGSWIPWSARMKKLIACNYRVLRITTNSSNWNAAGTGSDPGNTGRCTLILHFSPTRDIAVRGAISFSGHERSVLQRVPYPLQVTSAVRTMEQQQSSAAIMVNAAPEVESMLHPIWPELPLTWQSAD